MRLPLFCLEKKCFIREVGIDLFSMLQKGDIQREDVASSIIGKPIRDVLTMSMYLYNYIPKKRKFDFNSFLSCSELYEKKVFVKTQEDSSPEEITVSFEYVPIEAQQEPKVVEENKYHFQLYAEDKDGKRIPRDPSKGRNKKIADKIREEIITNAVVENLIDYEEWDLSNLDSLSFFKR